MTKGAANFAPMTTKGGSRHNAKPMVDEGLLLKALEKHKDIVQNMGPYEKISKSQGCHPKGLMLVLPLMRCLIELQPTAEIHTSSLRKAIFGLLFNDATLNDTKWSGTVWTNLKVERIGVILYHMRRLQGSDMKTCAAKLTGGEFLQLQDVVELISKKDGHLPLLDKSEGPLLDKSGGSRKRLKKEMSDISLDSRGFPKCLATPDKPTEALTKGENEGEEKEEETKEEEGNVAGPSFFRRRPGQLALVPKAQNEDLKEELGLKGPSKPSKKPAKKPAALTKGKPTHPSLTKGGAKKRVPWAKLLVTKTKKEPWRSYVQGTHEVGGKARLIVETTYAKHREYLAILEAIRKRLEAEHLTKEEAVEYRNHLYLTW